MQQVFSLSFHAAKSIQIIWISNTIQEERNLENLFPIVSWNYAATAVELNHSQWGNYEQDHAFRWHAQIIIYFSAVSSVYMVTFAANFQQLSNTLIVINWQFSSKILICMFKSRCTCLLEARLREVVFYMLQFCYLTWIMTTTNQMKSPS